MVRYSGYHGELVFEGEAREYIWVLEFQCFSGEYNWVAGLRVAYVISQFLGTDYVYIRPGSPDYHFCIRFIRP